MSPRLTGVAFRVPSLCGQMLPRRRRGEWFGHARIELLTGRRPVFAYVPLGPLPRAVCAAGAIGSALSINV